MSGSEKIYRIKYRNIYQSLLFIFLFISLFALYSLLRGEIEIQPFSGPRARLILKAFTYLPLSPLLFICCWPLTKSKIIITDEVLEIDKFVKNKIPWKDITHVELMRPSSPNSLAIYITYLNEYDRESYCYISYAYENINDLVNEISYKATSAKISLPEKEEKIYYEPFRRFFRILLTTLLGIIGLLFFYMSISKGNLILLLLGLCVIAPFIFIIHILDNPVFVLDNKSIEIFKTKLLPQIRIYWEDIEKIDFPDKNTSKIRLTLNHKIKSFYYSVGYQSNDNFITIPWECENYPDLAKTICQRSTKAVIDENVREKYLK